MTEHTPIPYFYHLEEDISLVILAQIKKNDFSKKEKERIVNIQIDMTESQKHAEKKQARQKEYTQYDSFQMKS